MKIHLIKFIKYSATILIFYNIFSLLVLITSNYSIKSSFWKLTPYDYKQIMGFPNHYEKLSLRNSSNRNKINVIALGGITEKNLSKLKMLNIKGFAGIGLFKKKPAYKRPVFLKNNFFIN